VALAAFLFSLPFTGLKGLWESDIPATPMLLLAGAGAILLVNAVIGDGHDERSPNIWLRRAALVLLLCILPLSILAALSMGERINQYGWTPERIWGVVAVTIAIAYGFAAWWAVYKGRNNFDNPLRPLQTSLAIGLCGLALFLALPILDFGSISARSQLARLESGKVKAEEFDWTAMAFDFGPEGRERLRSIATGGTGDSRLLAQQALKAKYRHEAVSAETMQGEQKVRRNLRTVPNGLRIPPTLRIMIANTRYCRHRTCLLISLSERRVLLLGYPGDGSPLSMQGFELGNGRWEVDYTATHSATDQIAHPDLATAQIEFRRVERRQLHVDGKPVGEPFE
jgi:hypothetical protein